MTAFRNPLLANGASPAKLAKDIDALVRIEKKNVEAAYKEIEKIPFGNSLREGMVDAAQKREAELAHLEALKAEYFDSAQEVSALIERLCERLFERRGYEDRPATKFAQEYGVFRIRDELQGQIM